MELKYNKNLNIQLIEKLFSGRKHTYFLVTNENEF